MNVLRMLLALALLAASAAAAHDGAYADGKKVGEWKIYEKSGALKQSKSYKPKK